MTLFEETPNVFEINCIIALFAFPFRGGDLILIVIEPSISSTILSWLEEGTTRIGIVNWWEAMIVILESQRLINLMNLLPLDVLVVGQNHRSTG